MPGFFYKQSPYNPASDWRTYFAQGIENMIGGLMQGQERKIQGQDIQNIVNYMQGMQTSPGAMPTPSGTTTMADLQNLGQFVTGAKAPELPIARTNIGQQLITSLLMGQMQTPIKKAQTEYYQARAKAVGKVKATKDEIEYWIDKGYSTEDAQKNARLAAEISAGIKPRASSAKHYENMSPAEKMKFLQTLKRSAEGPYYQTMGGQEEPLNPAVAEWAQKELDKLPMFQEQAITQSETTGQLETGAQRETAGVESTDIRMQSAPDVALDPYWGQLDDATKRQILAAIDNGYSIEEIISALGNK